MDRVVAEYLHGYQQTRAIQNDKLEYHSIVRALMGLVYGLDGHRLWSYPELIDELEGYIADRIRTG